MKPNVTKLSEKKRDTVFLEHSLIARSSQLGYLMWCFSDLDFKLTFFYF
jgi:hypothetical protein